MQLYRFETLPPQARDEEIYKRLGFRDGTTKITPQKQQIYQRYIQDATALLELKGIAARISIKTKENNRTVLENGIVFESALLASLIKDCQELLCMAVTAGDKIIESIRASVDSELSRGVVFDAVASEMVDSCFGWIQDYSAQALRREGKRILPKRISCGYADFSVQYQNVFFELLDLKQLGISVNKSCMLIPEKSATAVTGIY